MRCTKSTITEGIFLARFDTQYALASTFLRIQEHYESSRFSNRVFSLEQFMDWYADRFGALRTSRTGAASTCRRPRSNLSTPEVRPSAGERAAVPAAVREERRPFYVIGLSDDDDLKHELAHALFFTRPAYRKSVRAAMREHDTSALEKRLASMGYHRSVLADEVNAYLVAPPDGQGWSFPA